MSASKAYLAVTALGLSAIYVAGRIADTWPINNLFGAIILLVSYAALQLLSSLWRELPGVPSEHARKLMHLGNGAVWCTLPWLFDQAIYPLTISTLGAFWFVLLRSTRLRAARGLDMASNVYRSRASLGDVFFSTAFSLTFCLSQGNVLQYCAAAAILTFSDGIAALVGVHWGRIRIQTPTGAKSLEGALACFFISWPIFLLGISQPAVDGTSLLVVSSAMALLITLIELATPWGIDNVLLPMASCLLLHTSETQPAFVTLGAIAATSTVLVGILVLYRARAHSHSMQSPSPVRANP